MRLVRPSFALTAVLALAPASRAAQIVALDIDAVGDAPKRLAEGLSPLLVVELSRREGMSIISQADVRALLELEANKAALGCDEASCMTDIASSLGAELLATTTLSKVGGEYLIAMTLIQVDGANVVRRSTGKAKGGEEAANQALTLAIHELFRGELPRELQGPASMTYRGFEAALAGLHKAIVDPKADPRPSRKRVILDIVGTELDYDAEPKLQALELAIRRGRHELRKRALSAKGERDLEYWLSGLEQYRALYDDMGRVKEIRTRARERGVEPSARALRFLDPDPQDRPDEASVRRYFARTEQARAVVYKALRAYLRDEPQEFARLWQADKAREAVKVYERGRRKDRESGSRWEVLPAHAHTPDLLELGIQSLEGDRLLVLLRRTGKDGLAETEDRVWLIEEQGSWRIAAW